MSLIGIFSLIAEIISTRKDNISSMTQEANQKIQIVQQQTQIALADSQNQLLSQQLTVAAKQGEIYIPNSSNNTDFSLTATAIFIQANLFEATNQAIILKQKDIEATQTVVASQATPFVVMTSDNIIPLIKGVDNGIPEVLNWWQEYEPSGISGEFTPTPIEGKKCYGLAWNTTQYGYHQLIVFQKTMSINFSAGGWYVKVCIPNYVIISAEDIGTIKTNWLGKRYGDIRNNPWHVLVNP